VNVSTWEASPDKGFVARSKYRSRRKGVSNGQALNLNEACEKFVFTAADAVVG